MKDYRNFIILNNDKHLITATFANCSSEGSYKVYKTSNSKKYLINNLDSLKILNKHMAQILKWKENHPCLLILHDDICGLPIRIADIEEARVIECTMG